MNRVWKRFLRKISEPVGIMLYVAFVFWFAKFTEAYFNEPLAYAAVMISMIIVPLFAGMVKFTWLTAKSEIDRENEEIIRKIKGEGNV